MARLRRVAGIRTSWRVEAPHVVAIGFDAPRSCRGNSPSCRSTSPSCRSTPRACRSTSPSSPVDLPVVPVELPVVPVELPVRAGRPPRRAVDAPRRRRSWASTSCRSSESPSCRSSSPVVPVVLPVVPVVLRDGAQDRRSPSWLVGTSTSVERRLTDHENGQLRTCSRGTLARWPCASDVLRARPRSRDFVARRSRTCSYASTS